MYTSQGILDLKHIFGYRYSYIGDLFFPLRCLMYAACSFAMRYVVPLYNLSLDIIAMCQACIALQLAMASSECTF